MELIYETDGYILPQDKFFALYDIVIKLDIVGLVKLYEIFSKLTSSHSEEFRPKDLERFMIETICAEEELEKICREFGLPHTLSQYERVMEAKEDLAKHLQDRELGAYYIDQFKKSFLALKQRLEDELKEQLAFCIPPERHIYLENQFPEVARDQFPDLGFDMDEACNCMLFERHTATAYHLMRICEGAIKALSVYLGVEYNNSSWSHIIVRLKDKADKLPKEEMDKANNLREIIISVELIKNAWRNKIVHIDTKYNGEEAKKIFDSTIRLITEIANYLKK